MLSAVNAKRLSSTIADAEKPKSWAAAVMGQTIAGEKRER
jgi:hypothetical protein